MEAIPLILLAEWTYSNCAVLLGKDPNAGQFWTTQSGPIQRYLALLRYLWVI